MKEILQEVFSPIISYYNGWKMVNRDDKFAQSILNARYGYKELTRITIGAIILSTTIEWLFSGFLAEDQIVYGVFDTPLMAELVMVLVFYFFSWVNTHISRKILKPQVSYTDIFKFTFLAITTVTMLTLPVIELVDLLIKVLLLQENYESLAKGLVFGYSIWQFSLMGGVLDKIYGLDKKVIVQRLMLANLGLALGLFVLLVIFLV